MKTINLVEIQKAKKTLKEIEFDLRHWKSDVMRSVEIWEFIAMKINSNLPAEEKEFWGLVMDLYHLKYSGGKGVDEHLKTYLNYKHDKKMP